MNINITNPYVSAIDMAGAIEEYIAGLPFPKLCIRGGEALGPGPSAGVWLVLLWFRSFSSRRHFALRFENHTCILASGRPIFAANRSRANTSG